MSPPKAWAVNDGTTLASEFMRSGLPADWISSELSTCTGDALVNSSSPVARVPVTITVSAVRVHRVAAAAIAASASWACSTAGVQAMLIASDAGRPSCAADAAFGSAIKTSLGFRFVVLAGRKAPYPLAVARPFAHEWRRRPAVLLLGDAQGMRPARVILVLQISGQRRGTSRGRARRRRSNYLGKYADGARSWAETAAEKNQPRAACGGPLEKLHSAPRRARKSRVVVRARRDGTTIARARACTKMGRLTRMDLRAGQSRRMHEKKDRSEVSACAGRRRPRAAPG